MLVQRGYHEEVLFGIYYLMASLMLSFLSVALASANNDSSLRDEVQKEPSKLAKARGYNLVAIEGMGNDSIEKIRENDTTPQELAKKIADTFFPEVKGKSAET